MRNPLNHSPYSFFLYYLKQFVHKKALPILPHPSVSSELDALIKKHHVRLLFYSGWKEKRKNIYPLSQQYLLLTQSTEAISAAFTANNITHILLKGVPLNILLHGKHCIRDIHDIDVLVEPKNIMRAHNCLLACGYQMLSLIHPKQITENARFLLHYTDELLYQHPVTKIHIDLKWRSISINVLGLSWVNHSQRVNYQMHTQEISILNPQQNFFYLCEHAAKHAWERIKWLVDIACYTQQIPFEWSEVVKLAQQTRSERVLLETQYLLYQHFDITLGPIITSQLDRFTVKKRLKHIERCWQKKTSFSILQHFYLRLLLYPTWQQKYHLFLQLFLLRVNCLKCIKTSNITNIYTLILKSLYPRKQPSKK